MPRKGKKLDSSVKEMLYKVIKFCEREKATKHYNDLNNTTKRVVSMTGLSHNTIIKIKKEGSTNSGVWETPGKKRKGSHKKIILDDFDKCAIRSKIRQFYAVRKEVPTLRKLHRVLQEDISFRGSISTLRSVLRELGFHYKKCQKKGKKLVERNNIAAWRAKYLRTMKRLREEKKQIVYLDETYIHTARMANKCLQGRDEPGASKPIALSERYIIVHAGTRNGFVKNCFLAYKGENTSADYHHDINDEIFTKWVTERLIPNLTKPSVVVMDDASYHCVRINKPPNMSDKKNTMKQWLKDKEISFPENALKAELLDLIKKNKGEPEYKINQLLEAHGHTVVKLPPYHCDLNPIESIWCLVKEQVAANKVSAKELLPIVNECFNNITAEQWQKQCDHVIKLEERYWEQDHLIENVQELIINVTDSESDSTEDDTDVMENGSSSSDIEYLDSDFDYGSD